ncbi:hypothetical protein [Desulfolithobacter sp.]
MHTMNTAGIFCLCCLLTILWSAEVDGAEIYVSPSGTGTGLVPTDPIDLQGALDLAKDNGDDNTLRLQQGLYRGNFTYDPGSGSNTLAIRGGWNADFTRSSLNPVDTILDGDSDGDGQGDGTVLKINDWFTSSASGDVEIEGITIRNGDNTRVGGGIYVLTRPPGTISLNHIIIENNQADSVGGGCALASLDRPPTRGGVHSRQAKEIAVQLYEILQYVTRVCRSRPAPAS